MSDKIHVSGCSLCRIYTEDKLPNKVYFLSNEFIIFHDPESDMAMISASEHISSTNRGFWGRALYRVRKQFGQNIRLVKKPSRKYPDDHWHLYVTLKDKNKEDI